MRLFGHLLSIAGVFLIACRSTSPGSSASASNRSTQAQQVTIRLTSTYTYCGGAAPTWEMQQDAMTEKPVRGKKLYLKTGAENDTLTPVLKELMPDTSGFIHISLPKGNYYLIEENKLNGKAYRSFLKEYGEGTQHWTPIDKDCLKKWLRTPVMAFEVGDSAMTELHHNFHTGCFWSGVPCSHYTGPMPP